MHAGPRTGRGVAGAHTDGGVAGGVGGAHHGGAASGQNQGDLGGLHRSRVERWVVLSGGGEGGGGWGGGGGGGGADAGRHRDHLPVQAGKNKISLVTRTHTHLHQGLADGQGGGLHPGDDVLGGARSHGGIGHDLSGGDGGL